MPQFDPDAVARLRRFGGDALLNEMIDLFLDGGVERAARARDGVAAGNAGQARAAFHSLKSSAAQLGAAGLSAVCQRAEALASANDLPALTAMLPEFDTEYAAAHEWLSGIRRGDA